MKNKFKLIYASSFFLVLFLSSFYIFQIMNYTQEVYLMQSYQQEMSNMSRETLSHNSFASLSEVERKAKDMQFKEAKEVSYIEVLGRDVVVR